MISVGDHVTWAYCDEDVGEDEVGVVEVLYDGGIEADVAFQKGAFCLELSDLTKVHVEPSTQASGYIPPNNKGVGSAPRRPSRAYEEEEGGREEEEEDDDYGDDDVSSASSRRLNFDAHDGDDGTDHDNGASNDDGAWDTDEGVEVRASNGSLNRVGDRRSSGAKGNNFHKNTRHSSSDHNRTSEPLVEGDEASEKSEGVEEFDEASVGSNSVERFRPPTQGRGRGRGGVSKGSGMPRRSNGTNLKQSPASTSASTSCSPRRITRPPASVPKGGNS